MRNRPFLMALLVIGAIFLFFLGIILVLANVLGRPAGLPIGDKVAVVEIEGIIADSKPIIRHLLSFKEDDAVKAIVLRVNSPGGGVGPSQEIHEEVRKAAAVKPVVVSMGAIAASGGYYVAAPARRILANPGTITGSIGVIMQFTNFQELLEKLGLQSQVVKSGEHKDIGSPVRPMSETDRAILQSLIDDVHRQFVGAVAEGRQLEVERVMDFADGRIFTGSRAKELGLVDELGNLQDAIDTAAELGGISGEPRVVYPPQERPPLLEYLIEQGAATLHGKLTGRQPAGLMYLWSPGD